MSQTETENNPDPATPPPATPHPAESLRAVVHQLGELWEYTLYFLSAKADAAKATARREAINIAIFALLGLIGVSIVITAAVLFCQGLAEGLGLLLGAWAGKLIVGFLILLLTVVGMFVLRDGLMARWRNDTVKKYEQRRSTQRQRFGTDVAERAARSNSGNGNV